MPFIFATELLLLSFVTAVVTNFAVIVSAAAAAAVGALHHTLTDPLMGHSSGLWCPMGLSKASESIGWSNQPVS